MYSVSAGGTDYKIAGDGTVYVDKGRGLRRVTNPGVAARVRKLYAYRIMENRKRTGLLARSKP